MNNANSSLKQMRVIAGLFVLAAAIPAWAGLTDLATAPLATSSGTSVRPNLLFTLDNSGSMAWDFLPDYTGGGMGTSYPHCKPSTQCSNGLAPFQANLYNGLAYNPSTTYSPPYNYDGTFKPSMNAANTANWTAVKQDGYGVQSTATINLTASYPETIYCNTTGGITLCKQNGVDTYNPFFMDATGTGNPKDYAYPGQDLNFGSATGFANPLFGGWILLNSATTSTATLYNGALANVSPYTTTFTLNSPSVSVSTTTNLVTLTYSGLTTVGPTPPTAPTTGDLIAVSGNNCGNAYKVNGVAITVVNSTTLTYASPNSGSGASKKTCGTVTVTHFTTPAMTTNSIASNNTTVTVKLASLTDSTGHVMAVNDVINVAGASCDVGYKAANALVTSVNTTTNTITYAAQSLLSVPNNATCTITRAIVTLPPAPGISINGNKVTANIAGCCSTTGTANTNDLILRTGDYIAPFCQYGSAYNTGWVTVTVLDANTFTYNGVTGGSTGSNIAPGCYFYKAYLTVAPTLVNYSTTSTRNGAPYEYQIIPVEFCDSPYLTNCVASSVPTGTFTYPAPVRFCTSTAAAALPPGSAGAQTPALGGASPCQGLFSTGAGMNYTSVRYGLFYRLDVVPTRATYGNEVLNFSVQANGTPVTFNGVTVIDRGARTDCAAAPNCTYAEEMTNFANWYAYYRTRIQMMKTSAGKAFQSLDTRYRVGFATINESWVVPTATTGGQWLPMAMFDLTQKQKWYNAMYSINPGNSTPLREAVARAGRYFAGKHGLPGDPITDDPMEFSCQQNYLLITTDGYWNGTTSNVVDLAGAQIGNVDNNASNVLTTRAEGVYDGGVAGASTTLADTAAYYYLTDLRTPALGNCSSGSTTQPGNTLCSTPVPPLADPYDNVPADASYLSATGNTLMWQHMVTFSLGLANGLMLYQPDYDTASSGDFSSIKSGQTNCPFSGAGTCNWPLPAADSPTALDDLWHAAVNGRGKFYNARDPVSLSKGLSGALSSINVVTGSAAASATSTPNITQTDRMIFSSTYRTLKWDGEVVAQLIDPLTGNIPPATITPLAQVLSSITISGNTVTVSMTAHGLKTGDWIRVSNMAPGICDPAFNTGGQSVQVNVINSNSFTYPSLAALGANTNVQCQVATAGIAWSAQAQLDRLVKSSTTPFIETRTVYTDDTTQTFPLNTTNTSLPMNGLKPFDYNLMSAADKTFFDNQCTTLAGVTNMSQCTAANLTVAQISSANLGVNLVNYLRGDQSLEVTIPNPAYRQRDHFLGDTVSARPAYVRAPQFDFRDAVVPTYQAFQAANQSRAATLYIAANDGMLHAFDAGGCSVDPVTNVQSCSPGTGNERWSYVPHETLKNLWKLADVNYGFNHRYFVDGSPEVMDIYVDAPTSASSGLTQGWHTILVAGLNGGGRGYYAMDITNPNQPIGLWDICGTTDPTQCTFQEVDMGYTYGNPIITKRSADGRWVVLLTSGYNNVTPGSGQGFLWVVDAVTGVILQKIPTGSGSTTSPSGLAKIAAWADNGLQDNTVRFVYGGDLNGDVWRFDLGAQGAPGPAYPVLSPNAQRFTQLWDGGDPGGTPAGTPPRLPAPQPITTRPELGDPWPLAGTIKSLLGSGQPAVIIGTGKYLGPSDLPLSSPANPLPQWQTIYALKDDFGRLGNTFPAAPTVPNPRSLPTATFLQGMVQQKITNTTTGTSSAVAVDWSKNEGWYMDFPGVGERNNLDPQLVLGTLIVVTNIPTVSSACSTGGSSYMYQFNFLNGQAIPGSPTRTSLGNSIAVGFVVYRLPSGQLKVSVNKADATTADKNVSVVPTAPARSVSWRELMQ